MIHKLLGRGVHAKESNPIEWKGNVIKVLDQTLLPHEKKYIICKNHKDMAKAIKDMKLRGAPLIGIAAAFAIAMDVKNSNANNFNKLYKDIKGMADTLLRTRPTAVNLQWAISRMLKLVELNKDRRIPSLKDLIASEANKIFKEDMDNNKAIGAYGAELLRDKDRVLTHCNAGGLATSGFGTALGVIRTAVMKKKKLTVYADETRPYLQGARLTAWELGEMNVPHYVITDSMAGYFMKKGSIDVVIVGADRIAANGDVANKIGTYSVAVLAYTHKIPFYVAAPASTFDMSIKSGEEIPIEERDEKEVRMIYGREITPKKTRALHPAFDVTPAKYITAIITEKGVIRAPFDINLEKVFAGREGTVSL
jgi:methylthioribose-1-phosphate isomerase